MNEKNRHSSGDLKQYQSMSLESKIRMSKERIKAWYESWTRFEICNAETGKTRFVTMDTRDFDDEPDLRANEWIKSAINGQAYVAFSGGIDSTVLADLCAQICQRYGYTLYLLFVDTGLEYPEIKKFVKTYAEWLRTTYEIEVVLDVVRPEMRFDEVLMTYGYPVVSKSVSHAVGIAKRNPSGNVAKNVFNPNNNGRFGFFRWKFLIDSNIPLSDECCYVMKKDHLKTMQKKQVENPF